MQPGFEPDEHVDELCAQLDDLPLALELAAARTALLTTEQLRTAGQPTRPPAWRPRRRRCGSEPSARRSSGRTSSDAGEQVCSLRSGFPRRWTVEAAERVCEAGSELQQSLADKSLARRWESGRFGMLETVREFAAEQLEPDLRDELLRRLLELLTATFEPNLLPETPGAALMDLAREERPNVDVALDWATARGEARAGLELMSTLELYWATNDPLGARSRVDALLVAAGEDLDRRVYAQALRVRGSTYDMAGEPALAEPDYQRALEVFRELGDEEEADHLMVRVALDARHTGDLERAARLASKALKRIRSRGNRRDEAIALNNLAMVAFAQGDRDNGVRLAHEAAAVAEGVGFTWWRGVTLFAASEWLIAAGDTEAAKPELREGLAALASVPDLVNVPMALVVCAAVAVADGDVVRAGTLWGAAEAAGEREPRPTTAQAFDEYAPYVEPARGGDFDRGRTRGRALSLDEAVQYALSGLDSPR